MKSLGSAFMTVNQVRMALVEQGDIRAEVEFQNDINGLLARMGEKSPPLEAVGGFNQFQIAGATGAAAPSAGQPPSRFSTPLADARNSEPRLRLIPGGGGLYQRVPPPMPGTQIQVDPLVRSLSAGVQAANVNQSPLVARPGASPGTR